MAGKIKGMSCDEIDVLALRICECLMMDCVVLSGSQYKLCVNSSQCNTQILRVEYRWGNIA